MNHELSFGQLLKDRRRALDLTQEQLAERVGCSSETIRKIEADRRRPSRQIALLLADHLDVASAERPRFLRLARDLEAPAPPAEPAPETLSSPTFNLSAGPPALPVARLPVWPTTLIGRETEVAQMRAHLATPGLRLLTLTGPGGVGKTRVMVAAAAGLPREQTRFVDLSGVAEAALVLPAIAGALGLPELGGRAPLEALAALVGESELLLALDNFEQVLGAAPELVQLLMRCSRLQLLVSSRAALQVSGEQEFALAPLGLADAQSDLATLAASPAVELFVRRAQAIRPGFALGPANGATVAAICARLDGLPLAIELAVARLRLLEPSELLARLDRPLALLAGGPRDLHRRQVSLRDTIAWSYNLLDRSEQRLFARLAVFVGGWSLEAAEQICGGPPTATETAQLHTLPEPLLDELSALASSSLIRQPEGDGRMGMLETIRAYALECLEAHGEALAMRWRHARWFCALAEQAAPQLSGAEPGLWTERLESEAMNLRAALRWSIDRGHTGDGEAATLALRLAGALGQHWLNRGALHEGRRWLGESLELAASAEPSAARAWALAEAGNLTMHSGDYLAARTLFAASEQLCRALDARRALAQVLARSASLSNYLGAYEQCRALVVESMALAEALGERDTLAMGHNVLGSTALHKGKLELAEQHYNQAVAGFRAVGNLRAVSANLLNLGIIFYNRGDYEGAATRFAESLALQQAHGERRGAAVSLLNLGNATRELGQIQRALALYGESLVLRREQGDQRGLGKVLLSMGYAHFGLGDSAEAVRLLDQSRAIFVASENRVDLACAHGYMALAYARAGQRAEAEHAVRATLALEHELGSTMMVPDSLVAAAALELAVENSARAARLLGAAQHVLAADGAAFEQASHNWYTELRAAAIERLGDGYEASAAAGRSLPAAEVAAAVLDGRI